MRVFLFTLIIMFNLEAKSLFSNKEQADISQYISSLKELIVATQKTRGLTNSYLNGNLIALMLVQDAKSDMKKAIGDMESLKLASDLVINQRSSDVSKKLVELNRKGFKLKPEIAFERYTQEIEQILMLAQTVGKRGAEHMSPFAKEASFIMMEEMLPLSEYVGQLRGMGSGIAAKGQITKEQKETLAIIINEIITLNSELKKNIEKVISKSEKNYASAIEAKTVKIDSLIQSYVEFAKKEFYKESISINPDEYFTKGTEIISEIILAYDETNRAVLDDSKGWL
ncbi:MAG: nitrate- and nitrite sensing domain-containing protein [Sulfurimonas sp.]|uniref:nitrate- and nitrite sensing domain-containing protein n=1 Tax=Sulfurimonas sp. TaxID=2022749 RepID=UPI0026054526|nr:nitrate- and nitrite sensing domain-containing protein [Sulfurimonas sp.]MDD3476097.1 nitrate- and nitrite sensing domain-containing protein [Sulfurimonas sp.]